MARRQSISKTVENALSKKSESELSEAQQNILRLARLLVDIEYGRRHGKKLDKQSGTDYSEVVNV